MCSLFDVWSDGYYYREKENAAEAKGPFTKPSTVAPRYNGSLRGENTAITNEL